MRQFHQNVTEFELLPSEANASPQKEDYHGSKHADKNLRLWALPGIKQCILALPLLLALAPVVLLLAFSPKLSHQLGSNGCTPSGEFVLPYTSSVWDIHYFFAINIAFTGPDPSTCTFGSTSYDLACTGYSFTQAKVIDIAWDILVGRGGQAVLVLTAYKLFGRVIRALMRQGEVGYDLFSAVAFDSGSITSFATVARHAVGWTPIPRTRRAIVLYTGIAIATLYIVIFPSLVAAMTGYVSYSEPTMNFDADVLAANSVNYVDCDGAIEALWGRMQHIPYDVFFDGTPGTGKEYPITYEGIDVGWIDYYSRYKSVYNACPNSLNISSCKSAQQKTNYYNPSLSPPSHSLEAPMPGIIPYDNGTTSHWSCGLNHIFTSEDLDNGLVAGLCRSGSGYAWGFSFLLTFVTSVFNLIFVVLMYALWIDVHHQDCGQDKTSTDVGAFKDAVMMTTLAQRQYGPKIGEWSSSTLQREIVAGNLGMSFVDDGSLRRRSRRSRDRNEREFEYGDPRAGDWGGDVVMSHGR